MFSTVVRGLGKVVTTAVVAAAIVAIAAIIVAPRATGGAALNVLTGSMSPTIPAGSLVLVEPRAPETIHPGDVITFQRAPGVAEYVTHRVVRVQNTTQPPTFITKGDANKGEDVDPVPFGAVRGVVRFHAPYLGTASELVRTPVGLMQLAVIPSLYVVFSLVRTIVRELRKDSIPGDGPAEAARQPIEVT